MIQPTPAIVTQSAVRPLPRWALLLLCIAYVLPGFVGRSPWKNADVAAFGYMRELAAGATSWLNPLLGGIPPDTEGLLPYWLGALALQWAPSSLHPEVATRLPFAALLALTLVATWYSVYYLARTHGAQPVAFAFGGEAQPTDYARAIADAGLLALLACLGLAQLSHEITSYLTQLACTSLVFFAAAAWPYRSVGPLLAALAGLCGLVLSGAPALAMLLGIGSALIAVLTRTRTRDERPALAPALALLGATALAALLAWHFDLWRWRIVVGAGGKEWQSLMRLLLWFSWPAWPLALWTLWRWRRQLLQPRAHRHLLVPVWFAGVAVGATLSTQPADRALLLGLPALAALAAFALPTLRRSIAALIDWFTLLFFSVSAIAIWVIWLAMQTGVPAKPAANVAKLAPGFVPQFSAVALAAALAATAAWCALVWWRAARNRQVLWKSLVLPASGATLGWLLLLTLWLPLLDYARSYAPQMRQLQTVIGPQPGCVLAHGLSRAQTAALQYHVDVAVRPASTPAAECRWLVADAAAPGLDDLVDTRVWTRVATVPRPTDKNDLLVVLRKGPAPR